MTQSSALSKPSRSISIAKRRIDRLDVLVRQIIERGGIATAISLDVTDRTSISRAFDVAERASGPLTFVVNNAGVGAGTSLLDTDEATWDRLQRVNVEGVWLVGQEVARRMGAHDQGHDHQCIVNPRLSSKDAKQRIPWAGPPSCI